MKTTTIGESELPDPGKAARMASGRGVFLSAALFNWSVGACLILAMPLIERLMSLPPVTPSDKVFVDLFAVLAMAFGVAYLMLAIDFRQYRPFAVLGAGAKLAVVTIVLWHWLVGHVGWQLVALSSVDLLYALVFITLLRGDQGRTPRRHPT